jgi:signal transduction histidine kinase
MRADPTPSGGERLVAMGESAEEIVRDLRAVAQLDALPTLLEVLCDTAGLRFAAVARVTDDRWIACAVKDDIDFGVRAGDELDVHSTLCSESRAALAPIVIEQASTDLKYRTHRAPRFFGIESYVSVPILMPGGQYFGNLCAFDRAPADLSDPRILSMFRRFATLIGKQLERELSRAQQQAALIDERASSELREQFIAILGHDLRNPLQAVIATSEMLERRAGDKPFVELAATRIKTNARRMSALIDDVLDFARGRLGGGIGIHVSDTAELARDLKAVVRELQDAQPDRQILTDIGVIGKVRCDSGRIQQLASNLVANALTHGSVNGSVRVSAYAADGWLTFSVSNDGEPIPATSIGKVFEPFWRHDISASRQGLGLGLYICAQIVRGHGGQLSVSSSRESGTTFIARLPLLAPQNLQGHSFQPTFAKTS